MRPVSPKAPVARSEQLARARFERLMAGMNFVSREELEAVREMAALARAENEKLDARIAALEARCGKDEVQNRKSLDLLNCFDSRLQEFCGRGERRDLRGAANLATFAPGRYGAWECRFDLA